MYSTIANALLMRLFIYIYIFMYFVCIMYVSQCGCKCASVGERRGCLGWLLSRLDYENAGRSRFGSVFITAVRSCLERDFSVVAILLLLLFRCCGLVWTAYILRRSRFSDIGSTSIMLLMGNQCAYSYQISFNLYATYVNIHIHTYIVIN